MGNARKTFYTLFPIASFFVFAYPFWRLSNWCQLDNSFSFIQALAIWGIATAGMWYAFSGAKMVVRYVMVHWMGAGFILMTLTLFAEPLVLLQVWQAKSIAFTVMLVALILVVIALVASHLLHVKKVSLHSAKIKKAVTVIQISDVHIGSRGGRFMDRIVTAISKLSPDIVVITGDLIDSSAVTSAQLSALKKLKMPVYFCIGNHERYADLAKVVRILKQHGVVTLSEHALVDHGIQWVGIDDADRRNQVELNLPNIPLETGYFTVLLYHRPIGWMAAREAGVDLMLSGHTHGGQIVPFNWLVKQQFDRLKGLFERDGKWLYVSCGTGTWGPLMRLGTVNEITLFELNPTKLRNSMGHSLL